MRALLALFVLAQAASADFLEIRQVVEAGRGAKSYDAPRPPGREQNAPVEKLTVSDELIVGDRHLAEIFPAELGLIQTNGGARVPTYGVAIKLSAEGEQRMIAATKDGERGVLRLAVIIDGKLKSAPTVMAVPLGKNFSIDTSSLEEAKELAGKMRAHVAPAAAAGFEIRQVVEAGKGKLTAKLPENGEELTLSDTVIVSGKDVESAVQDPDPKNNGISITLTDEGGKRLAEATKDGPVGTLRLAILFDGKALSAPVVRAAPLGKMFEVTLGHDEGAAALANEIVKKLNKKEEK